MNNHYRIIKAIIKKESLQIIRDPSSIIIALILPLILLFIFGFAVSLDAKNIKLGIVRGDSSSKLSSLIQAYSGSKFFSIEDGYDKREFVDKLIAGELKGILIFPDNFVENATKSTEIAHAQLIVDGTDPNTAGFINSYTQSVLMNSLSIHLEKVQQPPLAPIEPKSRFWFNQDLRSKNFLVPGSIAVVMVIIGALLTALVVAKEWERGTMEAIITTPMSKAHFLLGKTVPYYFLGMCSLMLCMLAAEFIFLVPFRGSYFVLFFVSSIFLIAVLGIGLLISTVTKSQFVASQATIIISFLPSFMLSGFIFEIKSMPKIIQILTTIVPAKYFVQCIQTLFSIGVVPAVLIPNTLILFLMAVVIFAILYIKTEKRLE